MVKDPRLRRGTADGLGYGVQYRSSESRNGCLFCIIYILYRLLMNATSYDGYWWILARFRIQLKHSPLFILPRCEQVHAELNICYELNIYTSLCTWPGRVERTLSQSRRIGTVVLRILSEW